MSRELDRAKARATLATVNKMMSDLVIHMDRGGFAVSEMHQVNDCALRLRALYRVTVLVHEEAEAI